MRSGKGPYFLELMTYRYRGHSMSDPQNYRSKDEMDEFKMLDPIEKLKAYIISKKIAEESALEAIEEEVTRYANALNAFLPGINTQILDALTKGDLRNFDFHKKSKAAI